jgi:hypothetical protein
MFEKTQRNRKIKAVWVGEREREREREKERETDREKKIERHGRAIPNCNVVASVEKIIF